jgi:hypothetical protein
MFKDVVAINSRRLLWLLEEMKAIRLFPFLLAPIPGLGFQLDSGKTRLKALAQCMSTTPAATTTEPLKSKLRLGLCQISVSSDKTANINKAKAMLSIAKDRGAEMISLPECWNSPYSTACKNLEIEYQ